MSRAMHRGGRVALDQMHQRDARAVVVREDTHIGQHGLCQTGTVERHEHMRKHPYYPPRNVCCNRKRFKAMITVATPVMIAVVRRRLTSAPIISRRRVKMTSGTSANGMPNDKTTWLRIKV